MSKKIKLNQSEEFNIEMLKNLLVHSERDVQFLKNENKHLRKAQITFRDEVARTIYPKIFDSGISSNYENIAKEAYRAADTFIRVRDIDLNNSFETKE